jgi:hypothetical protein
MTEYNLAKNTERHDSMSGGYRTVGAIAHEKIS